MCIQLYAHALCLGSEVESLAIHLEAGDLDSALEVRLSLYHVRLAANISDSRNIKMPLMS
jgi:hypothetical protein